MYIYIYIERERERTQLFSFRSFQVDNANTHERNKIGVSSLMRKSFFFPFGIKSKFIGQSILFLFLDDVIQTT